MGTGTDKYSGIKDVFCFERVKIRRISLKEASPLNERLLLMNE